ncbi:MAG: lipoprotein signal peptidase [Chitinophagaceae bacterium]|nr:lipoprotein signal peptidase [Chitinophagaceae bacterium]MBP9104616.1 lipoprotein signal peptidase [Chitinophagaceae bacterium]
MKTLKVRHVALIIATIILIDQALKIWIKTSYPTGEVVRVFGMDWFRLHFIENPGMAWGWKFGNETGKMILTLFRLAAVIFGTWYIGKIIKQKYSRGFIICAALIYAGALGNLIDSMFYGMIFDKGLHYDAALNDYLTYPGIAAFSGSGYSSFLHGSVVDMLYFPMFNGNFPSWLPFVGGQQFEFFSPIFNIADASISVGVITLLIFQNRFFKKNITEENITTVETESQTSDNAHVL